MKYHRKRRKRSPKSTCAAFPGKRQAFPEGSRVPVGNHGHQEAEFLLQRTGFKKEREMIRQLAETRR
jgi:hypothetical protein